jgi:GlcNAc-P-P-Und epimerase
VSAGKVVVTGASGFVGQRLLAQLCGRGREIIALHNRPIPAATSERCPGSVTWLSADIARDNLLPILSGSSSVFHLAAFVSHSGSASDDAEMQRVNVLGTQRLAEACLSEGVERFIFVSSIAAADCDDGEPANNYGKSKKLSEDLLLRMSRSNFKVTVLRPTALFGEGHCGSLYELACAIKRRRIAIIGNGTNTVNFYYVGDFVDALLGVEHLDSTFGRCFIANDSGCSQREIVEMLKKELGVAGVTLRLPVTAGYVIGGMCDAIGLLTGKKFPLSIRRVRAMTRNAVYDGTKLSQLTGLPPVVGLAEGVHRAVTWYRHSGLL